jgi:hypothetical protein
MTELYSATLFEQYERSKTFHIDYDKLIYEYNSLDLDSIISIYNRYKNLAFDEKVHNYTTKYADLIYKLIVNRIDRDLPEEIYWECVKHCLQYKIAWACADSKNVSIEILEYIINEGKGRFPYHLIDFAKDQLIAKSKQDT